MATIITKNSSTASSVPSAGSLQQGELAVNVTDKKLYTKDSSAAVVKLVGSLGNQEANAVAITGGTINGTAIGGTTPSTAAFTTASASGGFTGNLTGNASTVTNGVYTTGSYADPAWITSLAGSKITGNISGNAANVTGTVAIANGGTGLTALGTGVQTALGQTVTGSGGIVLAASPSLTTPNLGTPSAVTLTNATGLPVSTGISGLGTNVATALGVNVGSAGAFVVNGGALGTPSSGTVTNLTGTASININGTVGATTPNTGSFTTLTTSSTVTINGGTVNGVAYLNGSKVLTTGSALTFDGANLGVGTASPTARINVYNAGSGDAAVRIGNAQNALTTDVGKQGSTSYGATSAGDSFLYTNGSLSIMADNGGGVIKFSAGGNTERARITSGGRLLVGTTTENTSGGVIQVSNGITFPATQSASSDANTLDDYEEGTWTPNQGSGLTVTGAFSSAGYYTKVGNIVTINGYVRGATSISCAVAGVICTNAPFSGNATEILWTGSVLNWGGDSGASCGVSQNETTIYNGTAVASSSRISFCITYRVA